jgi:hypothetical protein
MDCATQMDHTARMHYKYRQTTRWNAIDIPIEQILITKPIEDAAKKRGTVLKGFKRQPGSQGYALTRTDRACEGIAGRVKLPPVWLRPYKQTGYYEIIDGRHRFVASCMAGHTHIPAHMK